MNWIDRIRYEFNKSDSPVRKLILINVAVFLIGGLLILVGSRAKAAPLLAFFYIPSDITEFILRPWTLGTYMFFHADFRHILGNMLILYFIGRILEDFLPNKKFYQIYFGGGLIGGLLYLLVFNVFTPDTNTVLLGASGGVTAVVVAAAFLTPEYIVYLFGAFRIRLKWIALYLVLLDLVYFTDGNQGGHLAHIGGALVGMLFILHQQGRLNLGLLNRIPNPFKPKYTVIDERDIIRSTKTKPSSPKKESRKSGEPRQEEIDAILDKINQSGYTSLTKEEKELLFRASDKQNT